MPGLRREGLDLGQPWHTPSSQRGCKVPVVWVLSGLTGRQCIWPSQGSWGLQQ